MKGEKPMISTGIVRKIDELGRLVLPMELRRTMHIADKESIEIYTEGNTVMLKKYEPSCIFCGGSKSIIDFKGKNICLACKNSFKKE